MTRIFINSVLVSVFLLSNPAFARSETVSGGMTIKSDKSDINFKTGIRTYTGNVTITHLNFQLDADEVKEFREGSKIIRIIATGTPAKFKQLAPEVIDLKNGTAHHIEYLAAEKELLLKTYKVIDLNGNIMEGKNVSYHFQ